MSYENAVPKPLKFLISDGKMIDDAGNVIAESETLKDLYTKWEPEVKKYLLSDGSVVDENNNLIIKNDYYKKMYDQAIPKVAKYLHEDGTVDENPGGGSADLEDNKEATIDVSAYTDPVEVTPTQGKDGMKKVTLSLSNIPAGSTMLYAWQESGGALMWTNFSNAPTTLSDEKELYITLLGNRVDSITPTVLATEEDVSYSKISDTSFSAFEGTYTRDATKDVTIW